MLHVDALSRQIFVVEDNSFDKNLALCQGDDPAIEKIRKELELSESKLFEMRNGLVFRKRQGRILFYVPAALETSVIYKYHNEMSHVGIEKTVQNILDSYWFPEMKAKTEKHIRCCLKCIAFTPNSGKSEGVLHSIPKGNVPFATLHVDHLTPASRSSSTRNRYIFVVIDAFTKYVKLYAVRSTNAAEIIKCLRSYFEHYSQSLRIISDRGSCFTLREFDEFLNSQNVQHVKIAIASPQANDQVERLNRTILPIIAKVADERNVSWCSTLKDVEFACNNTVSKATNECPSMLLFGVHQRGSTIDGLRDALELHERTGAPETYHVYVEKRANELSKIKTQINEFMIVSIRQLRNMKQVTK
jgi:transposase InsO family protein